MGFLHQKSSAFRNTQHWNGVMLNKSAYGDVIPVLIGPNRVPIKLIWAGDWKHSTTQAPGQHVGKGLGGGGGTTQDVFSEAMQALLGYGPCDRIDSFWSPSGRVGVNQTNVNYTVAGGGGFIDIVDASFSGDMGVGASTNYSQVVSDYGDPRGSRTLSGTYYRPLVRGSVSAPGVYVISTPVQGTTRYTFNAADAGVPVVITYSANLTYLYQSAETTIPANPYQYTVPSTNTFWGPNAATQVINVNTGVAFTRISGGSPAAGQFTCTGSGGLGGGIFQFNAADAGTIVLIKWQSKDTSVDPNHAALSFTLENGAAGQTPWSYLQSTHPGDAGTIAYPNMALWQFAPLYLGTSNSVPQLSAEPVMNQYMAGGGLAGANPATVIKAILTDPVWGVGMDPTLLADWVTPPGSAFNFWQANNFFIALMEDSQSDALSVISKILDAGQAVMFWDQGLLQLAVYGDTSIAGYGSVYQPDTQPVVQFSVDDFLASGGSEPVKVETDNQTNVFNRIKVQWMNALVDYRTEIIVEEDTASINQNGLHEEGQQNWEFIRYLQQAQWAANLRLRRFSNIRDTYTWKVPTRYRHLLKLMKLVTVTWAHMGWNNKPLRIMKIEEDHTGLALTMEEFPYGVAAAVQYPKLTAQAINNNPALVSPGNTDLVAFEIPDQLNNYAGNVIRIYADPLTPDNWGGANIYVAGDNVNFEFLGSINGSVMIGALGGNGMALTGTRVQTSGGTSLTKFFIDTGLSTAGAAYVSSIQVKNNGAHPISVVSNVAGGLAIAAGASAFVSLSYTGDGASDAQIQIQSQNIGDALDLQLANPSITKNGVQLLSGGQLNFTSGWNGNYLGVVSTITQNADPDGQVIQLTDVNSVPLTQPSAYDFTNKNALLAIVDASGAYEIVAYQNVTLAGNNLYNVSGFHRGLFGTVQVSHLSGASVIQLGPAFIEFQFSSAQVGQTAYFRAASFNKLEARLQDYTTLTSLAVPLSTGAPGLFTNGNLNPGHVTLDNVSDTTNFQKPPAGLAPAMGIGPMGGPITATTTDSAINYGNDIGGSAAKPVAVNATNFYARWVGYIVPTVSGLYTLGVNSDDGANLFVGAKPLVQNLAVGQASSGSNLVYTQSAQMYLSAGTYYSFVLEWQQGTGGYECQLLWTPPGGSAQLIPSANLSSTNTSVTGNVTGNWWNGTASLWYPTGNHYVDFAATHINKTIDNVGDGVTYARPLAGYLKNGVPYNFLGTWNSATSYKIGDEVGYSGNYWLSIVANTNSAPSNTNANWQILGPAYIANVPGTISDNLVKNGDFDQGLTNWGIKSGEGLLGTVVADPNLPRGGHYYKSDGSNPSWVVTTELIPVDINKTYLIECWFKIPGPGASAPNYGGFAEFDGNGVAFNHTASSGTFAYALFAGLTNTAGNTWQYFAAEVSGSATPNPGGTQFNSATKFIQMLFLINDGAGTIEQAQICGVRWSEVAAGHRRALNTIDPSNVIVATGVDFSRPYTGKNQDNINDGNTYARTRSTSLQGGVVLGLGTGRELLPNPGFELNKSGANPNSTTTVGTRICDDWIFTNNDGGIWTANYETNGFMHGGACNAIIYLTPGVAIPNAAAYVGFIQSSPQPVVPGKLLSYGGWSRIQKGGNTVPAGITITTYVEVDYYDVNGTWVTNAAIPTVNGPGSGDQGWTSSGPGTSLVPSTAATVRFTCKAIITNNTGGTYTIPARNVTVFADCRFDDLFMFFQTDSSAGDIAAKGSVPPYSVGAFAYTQTPDTGGGIGAITIYWDGTNLSEIIKIYRIDNTVTTIANGNTTWTGLAVGDYYIYPYWDEVKQAVAFVSDTTTPGAGGGFGTNGTYGHALYQLPKQYAWTQAQSYQGHVALFGGGIKVTVLAGAGGGGGVPSDPSKCVIKGTKVRERSRGVIRAEDVRVSDELWGPNGWEKVIEHSVIPYTTFLRFTLGNGESVAVTPNHIFTMPDGSDRRADKIAFEDLLQVEGGLATIQKIEVVQGEYKVAITCEPTHLFYAGDNEPTILTHNILPC